MHRKSFVSLPDELRIYLVHVWEALSHLGWVLFPTGPLGAR